MTMYLTREAFESTMRFIAPDCRPAAVHDSITRWNDLSWEFLRSWRSIIWGRKSRRLANRFQLFFRPAELYEALIQMGFKEIGGCRPG